MKRIISAVVSLFLIIIPVSIVSADGNTNDIGEIIESIDSLEDWNEYLDENMLERDHTYDDCDVQEFQIMYDDTEQIIITDVVYIRSINTQSTVGTATHEVRSATGSIIFTLRIEGSFSRDPGTSCTCTYVTGSFSHPITSTWRSTPSYTKGRVSATKAYAKMYGTASTIIGANTINYNFYLYCTSTGTLSSSYSQT